MNLTRLTLILSLAIASLGTRAEKEESLSFGPFDYDKVKAAEKNAGGPWIRPATFKPKLLDPKLLKPNHGHCFRCHAVKPAEDKLIHTGMIHKEGQDTKNVGTQDAWVQQIATTRESSIWSEQEAVDLPLALPVANVLWLKIKGSHESINQARIRDHSNPNTISIASIKPGQLIEVFYTTSKACPNIRSQMQRLDAQLFNKGTW